MASLKWLILLGVGMKYPQPNINKGRDKSTIIRKYIGSVIKLLKENENPPNAKITMKQVF